MKHSIRHNHRPLLLFIFMTVAILSFCTIFFSCKGTGMKGTGGEQESLRQVLYIQSLYNNHPGEEIVPQITSVIDSMRSAGRNPYYFAALNILIDRLFSDCLFAEADSLAVRME